MQDISTYLEIATATAAKTYAPRLAPIIQHRDLDVDWEAEIPDTVSD
jgi:hypothetical protein